MLIAALGLGLLAAGLAAVAIRAFRARPRRPGLHARIAAARALPQPDRAMVLAALLRDRTDREAPGETPWPDRAVAAFGLDQATARRLGDLYRPGPAPDSDALETALVAAGRA